MRHLRLCCRRSHQHAQTNSCSKTERVSGNSLFHHANCSFEVGRHSQHAFEISALRLYCRLDVREWERSPESYCDSSRFSIPSKPQTQLARQSPPTAPILSYNQYSGATSLQPAHPLAESPFSPPCRARSLASRTFSTRRSPLRLWHLSSLDAPSVALVWSLSFAWVVHLRLPPWVPALLMLAVWAVYVADRLLDARTALTSRNVDSLRERHLFHWRHRRVLLPLARPCCRNRRPFSSSLSCPLAAKERNSVLAKQRRSFTSRVCIPRAGCTCPFRKSCSSAFSSPPDASFPPGREARFPTQHLWERCSSLHASLPCSPGSTATQSTVGKPKQILTRTCPSASASPPPPASPSSEWPQQLSSCTPIRDPPPCSHPVLPLHACSRFSIACVAGSRPLRCALRPTSPFSRPFFFCLSPNTSNEFAA